MDGPRGKARQTLNKVLLRPFDADEAEQFDRDRWGLEPGQYEEALATERTFDVATYE